MAKRSKKAQSAHDSEVRKIAKVLKNQGYEVKADINGFSQPNTINGYRPDVIAVKGNKKKIVEVETQESVNSSRDLKQKAAFQNAASKSKHTIFLRKVVDTKRNK